MLETLFLIRPSFNYVVRARDNVDGLLNQIILDNVICRFRVIAMIVKVHRLTLLPVRAVMPVALWRKFCRSYFNIISDPITQVLSNKLSVQELFDQILHLIVSFGFNCTKTFPFTFFRNF
ncbi:unnamed protein product [Spodoptera exigua]|nr:unnamed protein product [Spodoptera exigua]